MLYIMSVAVVVVVVLAVMFSFKYPGALQFLPWISHTERYGKVFLHESDGDTEIRIVSGDKFRVFGATVTTTTPQVEKFEVGDYLFVVDGLFDKYKGPEQLFYAYFFHDSKAIPVCDKIGIMEFSDGSDAKVTVQYI